MESAMASLARPLFLTRTGMIAERAARAFWPLWSLLLIVLAAVLLGLHEQVAPAWVRALGGGFTLAMLGALGFGLLRFRFPSRAEALDRLDRTLPGRPIAALGDVQAIGSGDRASERVWAAHVARMADRVAKARAVEPNLRIAKQDPYGLRFVAMTAFVVALTFGSLWRAASVVEVGTGGSAAALAGGPAWEGWVEPPRYTGEPTLYLADIADSDIEVIEGTRLTLRLYGEVGALTVTETVSGAAVQDEAKIDSLAQSFVVTQSGRLEVEGPGGRSWDIVMAPDAAPTVRFDGPIERAVDGEMRQPFAASDDFGVVAGRAELSLSLTDLDRRYGLAAEPDPREPIVLDLPLPFTGDRTEFAELLTGNMSEHPWVGLPVTLRLIVEDAMGQQGQSADQVVALPGRRFFDPLAKSVIEARRDILWSLENGARTAQVLRAVTHRPEGFVRNEGAYLKLRVAIREMEAAVDAGLTPVRRDELAQVLWDIALELEFGNLNDARERLDRAQDRLSEAIENGASDEEIAELMQELREAMQDYMRQLAEQSQDQDQQQAQNQGQQQEVTGDQLQDMLDRLQELMEQGRMDEAQQLLDQLREMMENMQVTQGQQGQGQQSPGQQAMEGLQETLRDQQGLSDEAFRDLQEQFNPGAQAGQSQQNQGRNGQGLGQGQEHEGGEGQGQAQNGQPGGSQGDQDQAGQGQGGGEPSAESLAQRQRALRQQLDRQSQNLPGAGTPEGDAARDALGRAGNAMENAEEALRENDLAGALDDQSEAMDALREGMRELGEAMAQEQQQGGQGQQAGSSFDPMGQRDPLGRSSGATNPELRGRLGIDDEVYRRAQELVDEIRRRSFDQTRPDAELDYLERLLDRF